MYYTGTDLHKFTSYLTTVSSSGKIVKQENIKNVDYNFVQYFNSIHGEHKTTVESTMTWYYHKKYSLIKLFFISSLISLNATEIVFLPILYLILSSFIFSDKSSIELNSMVKKVNSCFASGELSGWM